MATSSSALLTLLLLTLNLLTLSTAAPQESIQCSPAWFPSSPQKLLTIPPSKINDGYCDCPLDGADETTTGACSGSNLWAGVGPASSKSVESTKYHFVCPHQPSLQLAYSRVNDGICDCCDGADELPGVCPDICDKVLAEEREARAKLKADYETGSKIRLDSIAAYTTWMGEMREQLEAKIEFVKNWVRVVVGHM
jgi:hypothetical protein